MPTEPNRDASQPLADVRGKLIVALDVPTIAEAKELVSKLDGTVTFFKIGLGLQLAGGDQLARELKAAGKRVFLDYKYYDIGETIRNAVARAAELGIDFLTIHGTTGILEAAVAGRGDSGLMLFCVTVLTSIESEDFRQIGYDKVDVARLVVHRALQAGRAGCDGVIASAREAAAIKQAGGDLTLVTPGIRPSHAASDDQKRTTTPGEAIRAGADYLVVGRPITRHPSPAEAAEAIIREMADAHTEPKL